MATPAIPKLKDVGDKYVKEVGRGWRCVLRKVLTHLVWPPPYPPKIPVLEMDLKNLPVWPPGVATPLPVWPEKLDKAKKPIDDLLIMQLGKMFTPSRSTFAEKGNM